MKHESDDNTDYGTVTKGLVQRLEGLEMAKCVETV